MNAPAPAPRPRLFHIYLAILLVLAAGGLALATGAAANLDPLALAVVAALLVVAELGAVAMPGGGTMTVGGIIDMASLLTLGPAWTAWANVVATVVAQAGVLRRAPARVTFNLTSIVLSVLAAGEAFRLAGGVVGELAFPRHLLPIGLAGAVYLLAGTLTTSLALALADGGDPRRLWQRTFVRGWLHQVSFVALGALVALVYLRAGGWGLVLCGIPFLVTRRAFQLYVGIRADLKDFVRALSEVLDEVDPYTRQHSVRVAGYATRLARALGRPEREVDDIEYAALVHDLGKIGPQNQRILQKVGALSHEEHRTLRSHPATGAGIIGRVRALRRAAEIVRLHHERPDGAGYPFGLKSAQVPMGARILNVADAFDAMTSDRPYRRALEMDSALRELERGAGVQFDRQVVDCLMSLHAEGRFPLIASPSGEELLRLRVRAPRVRA